MANDQREEQHKAAATPPDVKREIERDYRALAKAIADTEKVMESASKPLGVFGRWFHTSTS